MSEFTPGRWWIAPPIFDGDAIFAPPQEKCRRNEVVAIGILNRADARLIAAAPEMYRLLNALVHREYDNTVTAVFTLEAEKLLARIDGKEEITTHEGTD